MPKRIDTLTPAQAARMDEWADRWIEIGLRTGEADWERFEAAARQCYEFARIPWPGMVVRVPSPVVGALAAPVAMHLLRTGAVGDAVHDAVRAVGDAVEGAVRAVGDAVEGAVHGAVDGAVGGAVGGAVRDAVDGAVRDAVHGAVRAVGDAVEGAVHGAVGGAWRYYLGGQFWAASWGWGAAWTSFFREVCGLELTGDLWDRGRAWEATIESACWWWPTTRFVMVCQRPRVIELEQIAPRGWGSHRLHCPTGPAIAWEGWPLYFVHGVRVDQRVVERPETLTPGEILGQPNAEVRRVMIDRFGVDRLMSEATAQLLDADGDPDGPSSRQLLMLRLDGDEPIVMVRVVNSTREPDGSWKSYMLRVPPQTRTCAEAVGWTFAMEAGEYRPAVET